MVPDVSTIITWENPLPVIAGILPACTVISAVTLADILISWDSMSPIAASSKGSENTTASAGCSPFQTALTEISFRPEKYSSHLWATESAFNTLTSVQLSNRFVACSEAVRDPAVITRVVWLYLYPVSVQAILGARTA